MGLGIRSHCVRESHSLGHWGSLDFHWVVPNLLFKVVGIMCYVHKKFKVFLQLRSRPCSVCRSKGFSRCDPLGLLGYRVPQHTQVCLISRQAKCSLVTWHMAWLLMHAKLCDMRFWTLIESCKPPSLFSTKCSGCKMLQSSSPAMRSLSQLRPKCCCTKDKVNIAHVIFHYMTHIWIQNVAP
jgi:hypothetical protein